jgi:tetratricopeptide (TPR) repeat protein
MTDDRNAQDFLAVGQAAFEAGEYRKAIELLKQGEKRVMLAGGKTKALEGEIKIWLVMAYEASGNPEKALELCRIVSRYPHGETREQGKRLLYILEAPKLATKPDWITEIPDLTHIQPSDDRAWTPPPTNLAPSRPLRPVQQEGYVIPEPTDMTRVNMGDERSVVWLMGATIGVLVGLVFYATM